MLSAKAGTMITISTLVGFGGDAILQLLTNIGMGTNTGWGLNEYFSQHGRVEATFIAGGMMGLFYIIYAITGLPFKIQYLAAYGVLLDILFRVFNIFPSLKGYYDYFNYFWSAIWGAIPMVIPVILYKILIDHEYKLW